MKDIVLASFMLEDTSNDSFVIQKESAKPVSAMKLKKRNL